MSPHLTGATMKTVKIGNTIVGDDQPTFIIAEVASAHQGNIEIFKEIIEKIGRAGANAIKFQKFITDELIVPERPRYQSFKKIEFTEEQWREVFEKARKFRWEILSDVFDEKSCDFMDELGVSAFKIHSTDLTNPYMLSYVAKKGKPILLGTGGGTLEEIKKAVQMIKSNGNTDIVLIHGFQAYPTKLEDTNLRLITKLKETFGLITGFHDHIDAEDELATVFPCLALTLGASVIEKHVILERESKGLDYESSLTPEEFKKMVKLIRRIEKSLGSGKFELSNAERKYKEEVKRNIVARSNIPAGTKIEFEMLAFKRSEPGLSPSETSKVIGKRAKVDIKKDEPITEEKLV
ncbi:MAG: N-acetylneuraminate synthase [Hadesarchaea archaeon]|nr:MAG: N-acetylneuraminate synthase [Hadesarchaea archaeon]